MAYDEQFDILGRLKSSKSSIVKEDGIDPIGLYYVCVN